MAGRQNSPRMRSTGLTERKKMSQITFHVLVKETVQAQPDRGL